MAEETTVDTGNTVAEESANEAPETATTDISNDGDVTETNTTTEEAQQGAETETVTLDFNNIKVPEGVSVSDEDRANFQQLVEKFGFKDQEGLQNFVDWVFKEAGETEAQMAAQEEQSKQQWEEIKSGWQTSLQGDAEFGKDYDMNIKRANDVMVKFGGSELSQWLKDSDLLGQPALLKTFARIGKEIEDARLIKGQSGIESQRVKRDRYNQPMLTYKD